MLEFRYDTQLLIKGNNLDEDKISEYFNNNLKRDCLLAVGDEELIKIHFHINEPWKVLEYCGILRRYPFHAGLQNFLIRSSVAILLLGKKRAHK